jgi:hypothetical protein
MLSDETRRQFLRFCNLESDPQAFELWVCAASDLEGEIGHGSHLDLISADYRSRDAGGVRDLCARILELNHPGSLARHRVRLVLRSMIDDESAVVGGLRKLVALRQDDDEIIPIDFVGFDSETDGVPTPDRYHQWDPGALRELLAKTRPYLTLVQEACRELIEDLRQRYPDDV